MNSSKGVPPLSADEEQLQKEERQNKHYFFLSQLQDMARDIPVRFQQRLSYDLLSGLASSLLDGQIFEIVTGLKEVQHLEEHHLSTQRMKMIHEHRAQKSQLQRAHQELIQTSVNKPHHLPLVKSQCSSEMETLESHFEDELKRKDMKIILELDQKVFDQQNLLQQAGIPGFSVTNNPQEIQLQMFMLKFIMRLGEMSLPP